MAVFLVKLEIQDDLSLASTVDVKPTGPTRHLSERALRADLHLTPDGDEEANKLGRVDLHIEAQPGNLPPMTPQETVARLHGMLVRMLRIPL
jgi:hypothetical protein